MGTSIHVKCQFDSFIFTVPSVGVGEARVGGGENGGGEGDDNDKVLLSFDTAGMTSPNKFIGIVTIVLSHAGTSTVSTASSNAPPFFGL